MKHNLLWSRRVLPNGLRVLLLPRLSANTVQLSVAIEYGANHDSEENAGTAHFLEHMLAGGSAKRIQLSRGIEHLGGLSDFYTDYEYIMSLVDILPEKLGEASPVLSKLLFDSVFEEEKLESERKIILNELAEVADDPATKVNEMLLKSLFKKHPVRRPIGGSPKTVRKLSMTQLNETYKQHFAVQNMILILTGRFSEKDAELVLQNFDSETKQNDAARDLNVVEVAKPTRQTTRKRAGLSQAYLSIGARTVNSRHADAVTLDVLNAVLGAGASSRLFVEMREKRALTYDIHSSHDYGLDFGYFGIQCAVKQSRIAEAEKLIFKEVSKLRTEKVSDNELDKTKRIVLGDILRGMDNPENCPDILAYMEVQFSSQNALKVYTDKIKAISADDICAAANRYLQEDMLSSALLMPERG